jgi:energy-coupling factor transporter ATP-binding protein EcfA2
VELRSFGWRHARRLAWAVRGVDLVVEPGERVLLLGPSGAGKSTLLAALAGLLPAESGEQEGSVLVGGAPPGPGRAGILFQDPQTQLVMARAGDDVAFGLENLGVPVDAIWPRVRHSLRTVGYPYPLDRATDALSGGEQQRLALAGVLAMAPPLLLLDEPTANLDPAGATLIRGTLRTALADRRTTMLLVEHRVADALPLIDRVVVLSPAGGITADGPPTTVFTRHGPELAAQGVWIPGHRCGAAGASGAAPGRWPVRARRAAGETLLAASGLGYTHPAADRPALSDVDLTVAAGQALAVLGPNGAGKSTLALLLGGLLRPTAGAVRATRALTGGAGGRVAELAPHRWPAAMLAAAVGSVFQNPEHQFVTGRVRDELALGPRRVAAYRRTRRGRRSGLPAVHDIDGRVDELLHRLRLDGLADANPYTLSGGEQRRLSVATALATAPRLLVLDEPTFGQDLRTWRETVALLAELVDEGRAVLTVTHDTDLVTALADRTVTLHAGHLTPTTAPVTTSTVTTSTVTGSTVADSTATDSTVTRVAGNGADTTDPTDAGAGGATPTATTSAGGGAGGDGTPATDPTVAGGGASRETDVVDGEWIGVER